MSEKPRTQRRQRAKYDWDKEQIRALRLHLNMTQREMADELEVRQQTISEWETGTHQPHRSTLKVLSMIAERADFVYQTGGDDESSAETSSPSSQDDMLGRA